MMSFKGPFKYKKAIIDTIIFYSDGDIVGTIEEPIMRLYSPYYQLELKNVLEIAKANKRLDILNGSPSLLFDKVLEDLS